MKGYMTKILVIGGGRISLSHIPHLMASGAEVSVVEPGFVNRLICKHIFGVEVQKKLKNYNISIFDLALVLTPPDSHFDICKELVRANVNCFVEKPLSTSATDSFELLRLAREANVCLFSGYVYRYHPMILKLKDIVKEIGPLDEFEVSFEMLSNVVNKDTSSSWRTKYGMGVLGDMGSHLFDLALYIFNCSDLELISASGCQIFSSNALDKFSAIFSDGKASYKFEANWSCESARKASLIIELKSPSCTIKTDMQSISIQNNGSKREINISECFTDVEYYLRGEEFQSQLQFVLETLNKNDGFIDINAATVDDMVSKVRGSI